ncbi:MAG: hypothetical protein Fur003_0010 [Candidatus Dojkabacteria bacterium]
MELKSLGKQIKRLRIEHNMSQSDLGDKVGVTWEMISRYERAQSSPLSRLELIAKAFGISELELLYEAYDLNRLLDSSGTRIPYFKALPKDFNFEIVAPDAIYNAPSWMIEKFKKVIAIDPTLLSRYPDEISPKGPLYIELNATSSSKEYCLGLRNGKLVLGDEKGLDKVIGTLIAQERRFIE